MLLHGFGLRYDLPIPLQLYLLAAGAVVALSFVVVALFAGETSDLRQPPWRVLGPGTVAGRLAGSPALLVAGRTLGVLVLALAVATGFFGSPAATQNPAEYLVWIYFWAGLLLVAGLAGNLYPLVIPFAAVAAVAGRRPRLPYPSRIGMWPAVAGYLLFAWFELASGLAAHPWALAAAAVVYTLFAAGTSALFGSDAWSRNIDFFAVLFGLVGGFAPVHARPGQGGREVVLRPWGAGLLELTRSGWDVTVFVVLALSSLAFDGLQATPLWAAVAAGAEAGGALTSMAARTAGLVLLTLLFLAVFAGVVAVVRALARSGADADVIVSRLAYTLVPIALAYDAAHNYSYLVIQGQGLLRALADPFATGAHLLPTAGYAPSFALANAALVWYLQVTLIVVGHIFAVYLAHRCATDLFGARAAAASQWPMLFLMVGYTATSIWILAQPITERA